MVGEGGLEPPHPFEYRHLKPARLPISPLARDLATLVDSPGVFCADDCIEPPVQLMLVWS